MTSSASPAAPSPDAQLVRLAALHAAIVATPALLVGLLLRLWIVALPLAIVVGVAVTAFRVRGIDDRVATAVGARPVAAGEQPRLEGLAESVAMASGVGIPRLFVIDSPSVNAVSWGVGSGPTNLAVTRGLLDAAGPRWWPTTASTATGPARTHAVEVTTFAAALFGPLAKGPLTGPVVGLVQGDEERSVVRADLDGVRATRYPPGMVEILELMRSHDTSLEVPAGFEGLCFAAPGTDDEPFAVHPPLDDRIDLLREI